jgi:hypothetical protein
MVFALIIPPLKLHTLGSHPCRLCPESSEAGYEPAFPQPTRLFPLDLHNIEYTLSISETNFKGYTRHSKTGANGEVDDGDNDEGGKPNFEPSKI